MDQPWEHPDWYDLHDTAWVLAANPSRAFYAALGGQRVDEKSVTLGGVQLVEVAYGWPDIRGLATQVGI
jgi:hypothetical protein